MAPPCGKDAASVELFRNPAIGRDPTRRSPAPPPSGCLRSTPTLDLDLLAVWLKSHADGSRHTLRAYERIGRRFVEALGAAGTNLKRATVEDVQNELEAMRTKGDGSTGSAATVNTYVAAVRGRSHKLRHFSVASSATR